MERTVTVEWQGRTIEAADPAPIGTIDLALSAATIRATERAAAAVEASVRRADATAEVAGRLLLRAEGLSSSAIEGLRAPAAAIALAEQGAKGPEGDPTANWVADNLAVVAEALTTPAPLRVEHLLAWHHRLMVRAPGIDRAHVGAWRPVIGWIGGANPLVAAHVAAPPQLIAPAMDDLVAFVGRDDIDPITSAAIAHAQFETIHPFSDGNGRIGRVLIGWTLATRLDLAVPPPASSAFARDIGGYLAGLTLFRQGYLDRWVRWFADTIASAAERTSIVLDEAARIEASWRDATAHLRSDSTARAVVGLLAQHPVVSTALVADLLDVSVVAARGALSQLADLGILTELGSFESGPGRPATWWGADALLALVG